MVLPKILLYTVLPVAVVGGAGWWCYSVGLDHGKSEIQSEWDAQKQAQTKAVDQLKTQYAQKELSHAQESQRAADALVSASEAHARELDAVRTDYARSLQRSETRSSIYQRQASSGAAECRSLASHTAELDRSLEAGRSLVGELRATLELRDRQLLQVGQQLIADRKLFAEDTPNEN